MNLFLLASLLLLTAANVAFLQATLMQRLRWKLYALRDELRWLGIENAELRSRRVFAALDFRLSRRYTFWDDFDLLTVIFWWLFVPGAFRADPESQEFVRDLNLPKNVDLKRIDTRALVVMGQQILLKHPLLLGAVFVLIILPLALGMLSRDKIRAMLDTLLWRNPKKDERARVH